MLIRKKSFNQWDYQYYPDKLPRNNRADFVLVLDVLLLKCFDTSFRAVGIISLTYKCHV